jgi:hypothetical protein
MKPRIRLPQVLMMTALAIALLPLATVAQGAKIRMPDFSGLAEKASESVDIALDGESLKSAGSLFGGSRGPRNDAQIAEVLQGLQGIYIKTFEFDGPGQYSMRDIESVVRQVEREGWKKLLSVREKDERVEMWIRDDHEDGGMFFVASEPEELVLINIVGKVNLESMRQLQGRMGIPNLQGILGQPSPPSPPARPAQPAPQPGSQPAQPAQPAR